MRQKSAEILKSVESMEHGAESLHMTIKETEAHVAGAEKHAEEPASRMPFLIVGIGASAGGYEAFSELLQKLPANTGMAFVLVQHLDPLHESKLSELLSRATKMTVREIKNSTEVEPNHVYVIPPDRSLTISNGVLELKPRKRANGPHLPIDNFFVSLAEDQGNHAIGVILSGNGIDGTQGLRQIKAEGGITFVQDETTAKYYGMPGSAHHAGCADFSLPPGAIAKELDRISRYSPLRRAKIAARGDGPLPGADTELMKIFRLLRALTGVDFSYYKVTTLKRRITRRMVLNKIENLRDYLKYLQQNPAEVDLLFNDILINVTSFFRDPQAFSALKKKVFPNMLKRKPSGSPIRIWVPGCSTGEEVYSLAISLHEFLGKNVNAKSMQIFGTDISDLMVGRARLGIYPAGISAQVSPERLRRYFSKTDHGYQISKFIRDLCIFARQNVAEDPPFSKVDLISCRNLLIYLGPVLQKKVMPIFHYSLQPGGYLMLGSSESIGTFANLFTLVDKTNKLYTKTAALSRPEMEFFPAPSTEAGEQRLPKPKDEFSPFDLQRRADEILLSQYTPGGVVVNSRMEVVHFGRKTGYYLEPTPGTASLNLLKMVREELVVDIRTAFAQAVKTNLPARKEPIRIRYNGHFREVALEVVPFKCSPSSEKFFLVLFHDLLGVVEEEKGRKTGPTVSQRAQVEIRRLREEISQTKESLQTIIEEQEATNEELKSANEEIQSSNEELQSTNEELETAKEELQSTNEELTTLNEELQNRNVELSQVNNDLNNLIGSFNMPLLMLGSDLTIRRFTPPAEKLFNLIPGDVGRRVSDINPNVVVSHLDKLVAEVIETLNMRELDVQDRDGRWFSLRIRPYRTSENKIDGAVVVLVDISDLRNALNEVTEMALQPMLILTEQMKVAKVNEPFSQAFGVASGETEGKSIWEIGNGQWNIPNFKTLLERVLPENKRVDNYRIEHSF
ncbi:MAG TPA: chemotaxis protein CheB, partial [Candidatus Dormibacteraeota bacterium]|nr:chemotaxis protein CheB [Candidatus Dormibacteraeota bacterium]